MITVKMTKEEYEAYLLYLKSIKLMIKAKKDIGEGTSIENYLADPRNRKDLEAGIEDVKAGRVTYIDVRKIWENIK